VIAHLNSKNEDCEARIGETEAAYKAEILALSADAEAKLKAIKESGGPAVRERAQQELQAIHLLYT